MNLSRLAHDGMSIAFTVCILLVVALPVLVGTGMTHRVATLVGIKHSTDNTFSGNPPYTPPQSTRQPIGTGTYTGWTAYHNNTFGFGIYLPDGPRVDEIPQTHATAPRYPDFMLQLSTKESGVDVELARVTVYDTKLEVNVRAQDGATDKQFAYAPTKTTGTLLGRKSVQYFYQGDARTVIYLIGDGDHTFEIRGVTDATDPAAVSAYWDMFNKMLESFTID